MQRIESCKVFDLPSKSDERGNLVVVEGHTQIPFGINRLFYVYGMDGYAVRGSHANLHSEFVMICLAGSCKIKLFDGEKEKDVCLQKPDCALYIPKMIWKEMYDFSNDCVLLVLSNELYDSTEYIRDKNQYIDLNRN